MTYCKAADATNMTEAQKREHESIMREFDRIDALTERARTPKQHTAVNAAIARLRVRIIALARAMGGTALAHMMQPHDEPITGNVVLFRPRLRVQMRTVR